ncbi:MAG: hypothetical protein ABIG28_03225 [archaeon]
MSEVKEKRIKSITYIYYMNPKVQEALLKFARDREIVPRYFEGFGKRPDMLQYGSEVNVFVRKGATSFHASEELWENPLELKSESTLKELRELRKGWDLLIDIDSPYLDCSKIATLLIIEALEQNGVKNYGVKFSGSKGMHIIVPNKAFPKVYDEKKTKEMFPEWPRAICGYLMDYIREDYNKQASEVLTDFDAIKRRMKLSKEQLEEVRCKECGKAAFKGGIAKFHCSVCNMQVERKNAKISNRRLKCLSNDCAGILIMDDGKEYYYCENCKDPENENLALNSEKYPKSFNKKASVSAEKVANLDLVLVASRHLFRMPYSLHEKTCLASVVLDKSEINSFNPADASPLKVEIRNFMPESVEGEAKKLLGAALNWQRGREIIEERNEGLKYGKFKNKKNFENVEMKNVSEEMYPAPIHKLLKGLDEGRKRALFVLLTFLRSVGKNPEEINKRVREWNEKNDPPLREGYLRSQIDWHLRQKKKIMPPNYDNEAFYRDIGLIDKKQKVKNPLVDVSRKLRGRKVF